MFIKNYEYGNLKLQQQYHSARTPKRVDSYHCFLAVEDVLTALSDRVNQDVVYFFTPRLLLIKTSEFSFRLTIPVKGELLRSALKNVSAHLHIEVDVLEQLLLDGTNLKRVVTGRCINCPIVDGCKTMARYLEKSVPRELGL